MSEQPEEQDEMSDIPEGCLRGSEIVIRQYWTPGGEEQVSVVMANAGQPIGLTVMLGIIERAKMGLIFNFEPGGSDG